MKGLIQKPNFDSTVFKPGVAIRVTINTGRFDRSYNAIVKNIDKDQMMVIVIKDEELEAIKLFAEQLESGSTKVEFLEPIKEDTKCQ